MRSPFFGDVSDKSHGGFVSHWRNYKEKVDPGKRDEVVWVPRLDGYCPDQVCGEGEEFWLTELVLLVFQNDLCRDKRRCVEAQIQVDVRQYHESGSEGQLNWSLPPRSSLFGRREKSGVLPILQYKLEGSQSFNNSGDFFRSLMDIPS